MDTKTAHQTLPFHTLSRRKAPFEVVSQLTGAIAAGVLRPCQQLPPEQGLMETFGVGRNTLREAIKILEAFGLVTIQRGKGTYVQSCFGYDLMVPLFTPLLWTDCSRRDLSDYFLALEYTLTGFRPVKKEDAQQPGLLDLLSSLSRFFFSRYFYDFGAVEVPAALAGDAEDGSEGLRVCQRDRSGAMGWFLYAPRQRGKPSSRGIYWHILRQIVHGVYQPGDKLPTELELMEQFEVSRGVIRETIKGLEAIGVAEIQPARGTFIARENRSLPDYVDPRAYGQVAAFQSGEDLLVFKAGIRCGVIYLACQNADEAERGKLSRLSEDFAEAILAENPEDDLCYEALNAANLYLTEICHNPLLQVVEHAVLQISENSRKKFIEQTLARGFQQTVAEIYRFGAEVVQGGKMEEAGRVAERYFELWRDLDII